MVNTNNAIRKRQYGAVSLFIVVFAALLMTLVAVSFIGLMITGEQQATANDLAQSAYDSAQAGVEDAKRLLVIDQTCEAQNSTSQTCANVENALTPTPGSNASSCSTISDGLDGASGTVAETSVGQGSGSDTAYNQAYTCVQISLDTTDYTGSLTADGSAIVPLTSDGDFNTVVIQWFDTANLQNYNGTVVALNNVAPNSVAPLLARTTWTPNMPSIMRAQLMQVDNSSFTLSDFDPSTAAASGQSDADTLFLYPSGTAGETTQSFINDNRGSSSAVGESTPVSCVSNLAQGGYNGYACMATITLPDPIGGSNRTALLRLSSLYNGADYRVTLESSTGASVNFSDVEPLIDSTGRASDIYSRIETRVSTADATFPYPQAAVDLTGNLCKDFFVTNNASDYNAGTCSF